MAFQTISGYVAGALNGKGVVAFSGVLAAADLINSFQDEHEPARWGMLAGVLASGSITASGLMVTIPAGFAYYARQVWQASSSVSLVVTNTTQYLWGCADGQVRITTATSPPMGWDATTACLLCQVVGVAGTATVTQAGYQQLARYANPGARTVQDGPTLIDYANARIVSQGFVAEMSDIPAGVAVDVPVGYQCRRYGLVSVEGQLTIEGSMRIDS